MAFSARSTLSFLRRAGSRTKQAALKTARELVQIPKGFAKGTFNIAKDLARRTGATAFTKAFISPIEKQQKIITQKDIGLASLAGAALGLDIGAGKVAKEAGGAKKAIQEGVPLIKKAAGEAVQLAKETKGKVLDFIKKVPESPIVIEDAPRLFKRIGAELRAGRIKITDSLILQKYASNEQEAADIFETGASSAGKYLKQLSDIAKEIGKKFPELKTPEVPPTFWDKITSLPKRAVNIWKASLVSQLATATRNLVSFGQRHFLDVIDDAMTGTYETLRGTKTPRQAFAPMIEDVMAIFRQVNPNKRKLLQEILDKEPLLKAKLYNTPVGDIALGSKYANLVNTFNRTQEYFARAIVTDAKIVGEMKRAGIPMKDIRPGGIPVPVISKAIDRALEMPYAAFPKSQLGKDFVKTFSQGKVGSILSAITYPFPRYLTNAVRTIWEFSPMGITKFLNPKYIKILASSDPKEAISIINKAAIGSTMMAAGWWIRNSEHAGEKWYEIKIRNKTIDVRPFGPLVPVYLFLGELLKNNGQSFGPKDWAEGMLGINRMAGTTLFVTSLLSGEDNWEGFKKTATAWAGEFLGGYTVPVRTFRDLLSGLISEEGIARFTKEQPLLGPTMANIPFLQRKLPEQPSITREASTVREQPVLRQFTGLTIKTKNFLEKEIDRLQISVGRELLPKTGIPKIDRLIIDKTGDVMEKIMGKIEKSEKYAKMDDIEKKQFIKDLFSEVKKAVKQKVLEQEATDFARQIYEEIKDVDRKRKIEILSKLKNKGLLSEPVQNELRKLLKP